MISSPPPKDPLVEWILLQKRRVTMTWMLLLVLAAGAFYAVHNLESITFKFKNRIEPADTPPRRVKEKNGRKRLK